MPELINAWVKLDTTTSGMRVQPYTVCQGYRYTGPNVHFIVCEL